MKSVLEEKQDREKRIAELYAKGPVLSGKTYCSPWCGGGCTKAAYDSCRRKAKALARRMGKGWTTHVHENLGWFYCVYKGTPQGVFGQGFIEIHPPHRPGDTYSAWIQSSPQFIVNHKDPKIALRESVALFDKHLNDLHRLRILVDDTLNK